MSFQKMLFPLGYIAVVEERRTPMKTRNVILALPEIESSPFLYLHFTDSMSICTRISMIAIVLTRFVNQCLLLCYINVKYFNEMDML